MFNLKNYNTGTVFTISKNIINVRAERNLHQCLKRFCVTIEKTLEQQANQS